jgi:hypothetical protein
MIDKRGFNQEDWLDGVKDLPGNKYRLFFAL